MDMKMPMAVASAQVTARATAVRVIDSDARIDKRNGRIFYANTYIDMSPKQEAVPFPPFRGRLNLVISLRYAAHLSMSALPRPLQLRRRDHFIHY